VLWGGCFVPPFFSRNEQIPPSSFFPPPRINLRSTGHNSLKQPPSFFFWTFYSPLPPPMSLSKDSSFFPSLFVCFPEILLVLQVGVDGPAFFLGRNYADGLYFVRPAVGSCSCSFPPHQRHVISLLSFVVWNCVCSLPFLGLKIGVFRIPLPSPPPRHCPRRWTPLPFFYSFFYHSDTDVSPIPFFFFFP